MESIKELLITSVTTSSPLYPAENGQAGFMRPALAGTPIAATSTPSRS